MFSFLPLRANTIYMKNIKKQIHSIAEPGVQYSSDSVTRNTVLPVKDTDTIHEMNHEEYMTVSEYFDKVRKALDLRYENIQSNNQPLG